MLKEILCRDGLRLELGDTDGVPRLRLTWDDDPDHRIEAVVTPMNLFAVLNGLTYCIAADPWLCKMRLTDGDVRIEVMADDLEVMSCEFSAKEYEDALLRAFNRMPSRYVA